MAIKCIAPVDLPLGSNLSTSKG